ncbi:hypothetical protein [Bremerella alba]|uniref:Uncharacterized protein n=1 Tax=Bremerella alba TaxID=980252 RepID=A0A7V9AA17_9BACT|nr:hypothetical protein [Bremerella alba]MBA2117711.1 hypothetical protein [Bremerella alba]
MGSDYVPPIDGERSPNASLSLGTILRRLLISVFAWAIHLVVTACLLGFFGSIVEYYREVFDHFELDLPVITESILQWSSTVSNYWYLFALAAIVLNAPIAIGVCYLPPRWRWVAWVWFAGYLLLAIFLMTYAAIGLVIPLQDLMTNIQDAPM